jgi:hypothetical protein
MAEINNLASMPIAAAARLLASNNALVRAGASEAAQRLGALLR